jgi:hypothetical protein
MSFFEPILGSSVQFAFKNSAGEKYEVTLLTTISTKIPVILTEKYVQFLRAEILRNCLVMVILIKFIQAWEYQCKILVTDSDIIEIF